MFGRRKSPYAALEKSLGYRFRKTQLLADALTHPSYRFEHKDVTSDNQRLEFLGDAVLGFLTAAYVYEKFQDRDEGGLTCFRSQATSGKALARIARDLGIGSFLLVGRGEERAGGRHRGSSVADALEAVIGAAYLDGGERAAAKIFKQLFVPFFAQMDGDVWAGNPKGELQEYSQRHWGVGPRYGVVSRDGPQHAVTFSVEVALRDGRRFRGAGRNKQSAESQAAWNALRSLGRT